MREGDRLRSAVFKLIDECYYVKEKTGFANGKLQFSNEITCLVIFCSLQVFEKNIKLNRSKFNMKENLTNEIS